MKKLLAGLILASSIALLPLPALAEVDAATARGVMQESGLWDSLSTLPTALQQGMKSGMAAAGGMLPAEVTQRMLQAAEASFTVERAQAAATDVMRTGLDAATVAETHTWNATPLGKKVIAQTKANVSGADQTKLAADAQAALQNADEARRKVLTDIVEASRAVDGLTEMSLTTALAITRGMMSAMPAQQGIPSDDQMREMLKTQLAGAKPQMQAAAMTTVAGALAGLSTEELQQYLTHLRSPAGKKMNDLDLAAIGAVMKDGGAEMGRKLSAPAKAASTG